MGSFMRGNWHCHSRSGYEPNGHEEALSDGFVATDGAKCTCGTCGVDVATAGVSSCTLIAKGSSTTSTAGGASFWSGEPSIASMPLDSGFMSYSSSMTDSCCIKRGAAAAVSAYLLPAVLTLHWRVRRKYVENVPPTCEEIGRLHPREFPIPDMTSFVTACATRIPVALVLPVARDSLLEKYW
jgi:hypothetical protein